jgi:hypothetical protein
MIGLSRYAGEMAKTQRSVNQRDNPTSEVEEFKKFLGPLAAQYSDRELPQLRREMYAMAEILLDSYLEKKHRDPAKGDDGFDSQPSVA